MYRKIIIASILLILLSSVILYSYSNLPKPVSINISTDNCSKISISGFGNIYLSTKESIKINRVIEYFNNLNFKKIHRKKIHNETPDCTVVLFDNNGVIIHKLNFYGPLLEYNNEQYKVVLSNTDEFYKSIEDLSISLREN